jgi:DNA-binding transcriptional MerR regulator
MRSSAAPAQQGTRKFGSDSDSELPVGRVRLPSREFSKITRLNVKALCRYHELGLLVPVSVNASRGCRYYYDPSQVPAAHVIRRLHGLGMPLAGIRAVLEAPDVIGRSEVIGAYLNRMQYLADVPGTLTSLQAVLECPSEPVPIEYRSVPGTQALAISGQVAMAAVEQWWSKVLGELHTALAQAMVSPSGPGGALYSEEFFEEGAGEVTVFVPVRSRLPGTGRATAFEVPAAQLAIATHVGTFQDIDRTYGALGRHVAEHHVEIAGPIREYYIVTCADNYGVVPRRIEVCWPIFHTMPPLAEPNGLTLCCSDAARPARSRPISLDQAATTQCR